MTEDENRRLKKIYLQRLRKTSNARYKSLIKSIREAFANLAYPGDENLVSNPEHRSICGECETLYNYFVGKTWEESLSEESSGWLSHGQSFFQPLAWQYYLPAFLIQSITGESFSTLFFLPNDDPELIELEENRIKLLTSQQCDAIMEYLEICNEISQGVHSWEEDSTLAALNYWKENYRNALAKEDTNE